MRVPDWAEALDRLIDERAGKPFAWGSHDCALWAADAVLAQTGQDFGAPFRGKYRSVAGSLRALKEHGAGDLVSTITAALGEPVPVAWAGRGDIVMLDGGAGVCIGRDALFVGDNGLEARRTLSCELAWKVT
jgi:hypothetical protein